MPRWIVWVAVAGLLLAGCTPWIGMYKIELGMSKPAVLQQMGKPHDLSGSDNVEYLWYIPANRFWERYYVHLVNGKVVSYGQLGKQTDPPR